MNIVEFSVKFTEFRVDDTTPLGAGDENEGDFVLNIAL